MESNTYFDIPSFLSDLLSHLSKDGLLVSGDTAQRYFLLSARLHPETMDDTREIIRMLVCKNEADIETFEASFYRYFYPVPPSKDEKKKQKKVEEKKKENIRLQESLKRLAEENYEDEIAKAEEALEAFKRNIAESNDETDVSKALTKIDPGDPVIEGSIHRIKDPVIRDAMDAILHGNVQSLNWQTLQQLTERSNDILRAFASRDSAKMIPQFSKLITSLKNYTKVQGSYELDLMEKEMMLDSALMKHERHQKEIDEKIAQIKKNENFILKEDSNVHRLEFHGKNAVQTIYDDMGKLADTDIKRLNPEEKQKIYAYIQRNSQKFYTILRRRMKTVIRQQIDMKETVRKACETGGIPIRIAYEKQKPSKPNIVLLLDISGSCRNASEMMLVYMHYMKRVFRGGCRAFAFVGHLYDITESMYLPEADEAVEAVLSSIPSRGVYSNYALAFHDLQEHFDSIINKDSIVIFIGDARNNKNASAEEIVKKYADRAKKMYWLNTEDMHLWNTGDSIMKIYEPYMNEVKEVKTVKQLTEFLLDL